MAFESAGATGRWACTELVSTTPVTRTHAWTCRVLTSSVPASEPPWRVLGAIGLVTAGFWLFVRRVQAVAAARRA